MTLAILRANNPCALRPHPGEGWRGAKGVIRLPGGAYQSFSSTAWGLRAALRNLHTYRTRHGLGTPREIIGRWAPASDDNPTDAYARNVAKWCGVGIDEPVPFDHSGNRALLLAIARQETGGAYRPRPADIAEAFRLMAEEERARGRDPSPYLPPASTHPIERSRAEVERVPRRGWFGLGALITGALGWFQDRLYDIGVYPREAIGWASARAAEAPPGLVLGIGLIALAAWLFFSSKDHEYADRDFDIGGDVDEARPSRKRSVHHAPAQRRDTQLHATGHWRV